MRVAEIGTWVAVLRSGRVRVIGFDGGRIIATRGEGDILGEQALIDGKLRSATVQTDSPVRVLAVGVKEFDHVLGRHPRVMRVLCAVMSERLRQSDRALGSQGGDALTKVVRLLVSRAEDHGVRVEQGVSVNIGAQVNVARFLGVSRESVVRTLKALRDDGIISTRRGLVTIRDLDALRRRVE
ncbi:Crp/Fnr family transcriptional regulator [Kibdelosporangium aridum]|uniref:Crp/Fnr family transcriptional regulator n=2 Tax=Kibdelosporangium aridum TaxID=2030 RepID=A0A428ZTT9_KIBAR|nr:Crp/Fnr family transcriptional regulator [Kibdelosporangium aridum]